MQYIYWKIFQVLEGVPATTAAATTTMAYCGIKSVIIYIMSQLLYLYLVRSNEPVGDIMSVHCSDCDCMVASRFEQEMSKYVQVYRTSK